MPFNWQVHLWGPMTHCVRRGSLAPGKGKFGVEPPAKTSSRKLLLPSDEYKSGVMQTAIPPFTKLL